MQGVPLASAGAMATRRLRPGGWPPGAPRRWLRQRHSCPRYGQRRTMSRNLEAVEQDVSYNGFWGALTTFPRRRPFATNIALAGIFSPLADYNVQRAEGGDWDSTRSLLFCTFGIFNGGMWWLAYIVLLGRLCPRAIPFANMTWAEKLRDRAGQRDLAKQVILDNFVWVPLAFFPSFYAFKAVIQGVGDSEREPLLTTAWRLYRNHLMQDWAASMAFWIPGDLLVFAIPAWLRLPASHGLGFSWFVLLSWMRGAKSDAGE
mmetsp:Transcript_44192/g.99609  ORF Transcript_44192/g.99609 Transcript_44192/m.99609 type:complete len:260 (+) Transcript_44192:69-848(+)